MGGAVNGADEHNTGYRAYARAHGMSPDEMLAHDMQRWPGGCMAGFIVWIGGQKAAFRMAHPEAFVDGAMKVKKQPPDLTAGEFNRREC